MAFVIIGALGFLWMGFWVFMYDKPEKSKHVNQAELDYILQDDNETVKTEEKKGEEKTIPFWKCFCYRQTWSFIVGKFFTEAYGGSIFSGHRLTSPTNTAMNRVPVWVLHSLLRFMPL